MAVGWLMLVFWAVPVMAFSQATSQPSQGEQGDPPVTTEVDVTVIGSTPLPGVGLPADQLPAPAQVIDAAALQSSGALDLADFLVRRINGVSLNENQGNPFQPDLSYRGYTASPLLGTPQGLSVYMDGVRLNQPFGDVVSWDLIPRIAISTGVMMPGSNPLFGLNTLGGALSIQTKDGRTSPGTSVQATYGSDDRRTVEFEHGGSRTANGLAWYVAGNLFSEDGWRTDSPSEVGQLFGKVGWLRPASALTLAVGYADNSLTGNGIQEQRLLGTRLRQRLHQARRHGQPVDTRLAERAARLEERGHVHGQRLLPSHPDEHAERRYQRRFARPGRLSAHAGRAGGAGGRGLHRRADQRCDRAEHTLPFLAVSRQRAAERRAG